MKILILLCLPLTVLLASCSSTPTSRIEDNPVIYEKLNSKHKKLVSEGKIQKGMTPPAVFLAMGRPDHKIEGNKDGKQFERWDYNVLTPVYRNSFYSNFGYGYGRYGRYGRSSRFGLGYSPSIHYVPRRGATVDFTNGKVSGWSSVRRNY